MNFVQRCVYKILSAQFLSPNLPNLWTKEIIVGGQNKFLTTAVLIDGHFSRSD